MPAIPISTLPRRRRDRNVDIWGCGPRRLGCSFFLPLTSPTSTASRRSRGPTPATIITCVGLRMRGTGSGSSPCAARAVSESAVSLTRTAQWHLATATTGKQYVTSACAAARGGHARQKAVAAAAPAMFVTQHDYYDNFLSIDLIL